MAVSQGVFSKAQGRSWAPHCCCLLSPRSQPPLNHSSVIFCTSPSFTVISLWLTASWEIPESRYTCGRWIVGAWAEGLGGSLWRWVVAETLSFWHWKLLNCCWFWCETYEVIDAREETNMSVCISVSSGSHTWMWLWLSVFTLISGQFFLHPRVGFSRSNLLILLSVQGTSLFDRCLTSGSACTSACPHIFEVKCFQNCSK